MLEGEAPMSAQANYIDRDAPDNSGITLLHEKMTDGSIPGPASRPPLHRHRFYELVLVLRGSCEFFSGQGRMSLIPGDLLLLPPDQPHTYYLQNGAQACRCQFEPDVFSGVLSASLQDMVYWNMPQGNAAEKLCEKNSEFRGFGQNCCVCFVIVDRKTEKIFFICNFFRHCLFYKI